MLPRPASTSLFQHTGRVGMASPLFEVVVRDRGCYQPGLDPKVLFVYFLRSGRHIGTDESIVVRAWVTTPESGRLSTSRGVVDALCWRNTPLSVRLEFRCQHYPSDGSLVR
eukprot:scaffold66238_cov43-Cyclotella_meneghiniana.AAC.1